MHINSCSQMCYLLDWASIPCIILHCVTGMFHAVISFLALFFIRTDTSANVARWCVQSRSADNVEVLGSTLVRQRTLNSLDNNLTTLVRPVFPYDSLNTDVLTNNL